MPLPSEMPGIYKLKLGLHVINQAHVLKESFRHMMYLNKKTRLA